MLQKFIQKISPSKHALTQEKGDADEKLKSTGDGSRNLKE
jgi:hypothetical protein